MELYSKEELLKELKKEYSCGGECDHCPEVLDAGSCSVLRCIRRIIDNVPTVDLTKNQAYDQGFITAMRIYSKPKGEWIPISERLPDKNMPCLVSVGKLNLTKIAMYSDLMETIDHKIFWIGDYGKDNFQNITEYVNAWQPLPKPYKEGERE